MRRYCDILFDNEEGLSMRYNDRDSPRIKTALLEIASLCPTYSYRPPTTTDLGDTRQCAIGILQQTCALPYSSSC